MATNKHSSGTTKNGNGIARKKWTKRDEREELKIVRQLMREKKSVIPAGFGAVVERDLTGGGKYAISRRLAMLYLEKPWRETAKNIAERMSDPKAAADLKEWAECIEQHARSYRDLASWMEKASLRMQIALCACPNPGQIASRILQVS